MCGIVGWVKNNESVDAETFANITSLLVHRGPDDTGIYFSENKQVSLGHTRLSFLDLSESGRQPLVDKTNKLVISFNGEIYNYIELKEKLNYNFKTNTDTEVILAAYNHWGVDFINYLKGMFAIAIFDEHKQKLLLFRDRFGIKPLYYFHDKKDFLFASELKSILSSGVVKKELDYSSFADFFVYRYVPSPKTIWKNVFKIPPAHFLELNLDTFESRIVEYWVLKSNDKNCNQDELVKEVGDILNQSVYQHVRADVPIGSFLSGGYDSSAMVYYMKKNNLTPDTFSIGFENWENSEHIYAKVVADHLKVPNDYLIANENSLDLIEKMPDVYDEPIADISIIPTFMVSQLARKKVKAVLSGEGADEIFGGYTWQHDFFNINYPESIFDKIKNFFSPHDTVGFYAQAMAMGWFDKAELQKMLHPDLHKYIPDDVHWFYRKNLRKDLTPVKSVQYMDMKCFMGELVLTKIDRASMANSLEVRVPFLDHTLIEKLFSCNEQCYLDKNQTKKILYENLKNVLPKEILTRKKQGFVGPDAYYMNIEWYKKQLTNSKLVEHNIIKKEYIDELLKQTYNWKLWKILVMEKWFARWGF
jgi:asparagine synthase (glutamine-hydrolysing)